MTSTTLPRSTFANLTSTLALVVALGGGGAYAASLAKNSVGSAQVKNGAIKAKDVQAGALTGAQVEDGSLTGAELQDGSLTGVELKDGSITGADVDESTLALPPGPLVVEGPYTYHDTHHATLSRTWKEYARVTFTAPAAGYVRIEAEATVVAASGAAAGGTIDTLFYIDDDGAPPYDASGAFTLWGSPDPAGTFVQHPTASDVVAVKPGTYVVTIQMREHLTSHFSTLHNAQIDVQFFPGGSAQPS